MQVTFYKNKSDKIVFDKLLEQIATVQCSIWGQCDVTAPTLRVKNFSNTKNANYAYIPDFGRYYYIDPPTLTDGGFCLITAHCDVLMSFKSQIRATTQIVARNEYLYNLYLPDSNFKTSQKRQIQVLPFDGRPFGTGGFYSGTACCILTVAGGNTAAPNNPGTEGEGGTGSETGGGGFSGGGSGGGERP